MIYDDHSGILFRLKNDTIFPHRYMETVHHTDVCHTVELRDIQWPMLISEPHELLLTAKSSLHVSRRGGAMLRLIFPRGTPWSLEAEQAILHDSNRLMQAARRLVCGMPAPN